MNSFFNRVLEVEHREGQLWVRLENPVPAPGPHWGYQGLIFPTRQQQDGWIHLETWDYAPEEYPQVGSVLTDYTELKFPMAFDTGYCPIFAEGPPTVVLLPVYHCSWVAHEVHQGKDGPYVIIGTHHVPLRFGPNWYADPEAFNQACE